MVLFAALLAAAMDIVSLQKMAARFAPVEVTADLSGLAPQERAALAKIVEAARLMDTLYLRQVWAGNHPLLLDLSQDATPLGRARLHLFLLYKGPWSSLDDDAPFIPGVPPRPDQANFYPPGATKERDRGLAEVAAAARPRAGDGLLRHHRPAARSKRQRRTSPACSRSSCWWTRACSIGRWSGPCTSPSWPRRSAPSASAPTWRTAKEWRCS